MLLLPITLASQTPATQAKTKTGPVKLEVKHLALKGVKAIDQKELRLSIVTDQSHCVSMILTPICWVSKTRYFYTRKYLDHVELARDVLRTRVFYWKRGYRDTEVDTLVKQTDADDESSPSLGNPRARMERSLPSGRNTRYSTSNGTIVP